MTLNAAQLHLFCFLPALFLVIDKMQTFYSCKETAAHINDLINIAAVIKK